MFNDNGSFLLALFEFFLFFAWFMCLFWVLGDIFRSRDLGGGAKTLWVIFVIVIPWLGILVYLIARGHGMQERQLDQAQETQAAQAEYIKSVAAPASGNAASQIANAKGLLDSGTIARRSSTRSRRRRSLPDRRPAGSAAYRWSMPCRMAASSTSTLMTEGQFELDAIARDAGLPDRSTEGAR